MGKCKSNTLTHYSTGQYITQRNTLWKCSSLSVPLLLHAVERNVTLQTSIISSVNINAHIKKLRLTHCCWSFSSNGAQTMNRFNPKCHCRSVQQENILSSVMPQTAGLFVCLARRAGSVSHMWLLHMARNHKQDTEAVTWKQVAESIPVHDSMHESWNEKSIPCQSLQKAAWNDKVTCQNVLKIPYSTKEKELVASCLVSKQSFPGVPSLLHTVALTGRQTDTRMCVCLYYNNK